MATIEIDVETYKSMMDKIKDLETEKVRQDKKINTLLYQTKELKESINIAKSASWYDRVFGWKQIKDLIEN